MNLGGLNMKMNFLLMTLCAGSLAACGAVSTGNNTGFLDDGKDVTFLQQGATSCPGVIDSGNPIYERYPLRCGPQTQVIPR